jgi:hypothetical protein
MRGEDIDWPGIRAAAVVIGIRAAARNASSDLPPVEQKRFVERVMKRASREKWLAKAQGVTPPTIAHPSATLPASDMPLATARPRALQVRQFAEKPMSASVRSGAETLQNKLANDSRDTRVAWSEAAKNHAKHFAKLSPSTDHKRAIAARNWHSVAGGVHGWDGREVGTQINLNVLSLPSARL